MAPTVHSALCVEEHLSDQMPVRVKVVEVVLIYGFEILTNCTPAEEASLQTSPQWATQ